MGSVKDFATSLVATAPSPATSGTSLVVTAGEGVRFPSTPFKAVLHPSNEMPTLTNAEVVNVTAVSTDTLTITRAQNSSTAKSVAVGWRISNPLLQENIVESVNGSSGAITNVTKNTDTNIKTNSWVLDQDNMSGNDDTKVPTQQSVKAYVDTLSAQSSWQTWSLQNGWTNYAYPYGGTNNYKKVGGIVFLRGLISSGTTATGTLILTLPSGYRPSMNLIFTVPASGDQLAELRVGTDGTITVGDRDFQSDWTSMCVSFPVD